MEISKKIKSIMRKSSFEVWIVWIPVNCHQFKRTGVLLIGDSQNGARE